MTATSEPHSADTGNGGLGVVEVLVPGSGAERVLNTYHNFKLLYIGNQFEKSYAVKWTKFFYGRDKYNFYCIV